jgi:hypothetical protein
MLSRFAKRFFEESVEKRNAGQIGINFGFPPTAL